MGAACQTQEHRDLHPAEYDLRTSISTAFFAAVADLDLRLRFFASVKDRSHEFFARFTQLDYARAMAFIAIDEKSGDMLGVCGYTPALTKMAEYAILVRLRPQRPGTRLALDAEHH